MIIGKTFQTPPGVRENSKPRRGVAIAMTSDRTGCWVTLKFPDGSYGCYDAVALGIPGYERGTIRLLIGHGFKMLATFQSPGELQARIQEDRG